MTQGEHDRLIEGEKMRYRALQLAAERVLDSYARNELDPLCDEAQHAIANLKVIAMAE